jgi:hypothetical protein
MMLQTKNVEGAKKALNAATEAVRKVKQAVLK